MRCQILPRRLLHRTIVGPILPTGRKKNPHARGTPSSFTEPRCLASCCCLEPLLQRCKCCIRTLRNITASARPPTVYTIFGRMGPPQVGHNRETLSVGHPLTSNSICFGRINLATSGLSCETTYAMV